MDLKHRLEESRKEQVARDAKITKKMNGSNPFDLYSGHPDSKKATTELKKAVTKFGSEVGEIRKRYVSTGIDDTASTDAIIDYILWKVLKVSLIKNQ